MSKAKGRVGQERRLASMNPASDTLGAAWLPDAAECQREDFDVDLLGGIDRVHVRYLLHRGRVVGFALIQQALVGEDEWADLVKADTAHDEVHVHRYTATGGEISRTVIRPIRSAEDVTVGLDMAERLIYDHWEENRRRWDGGR